MVVNIEMEKKMKNKKSLPNGRKNCPRDNTKLRIVKYLFSKGPVSTASVYEILNHAEIGADDYPYIKKVLNEMINTKWLKVIYSGARGSVKSNYSLCPRGRDAINAVRKLPENNPLKDLDTFYGI